MAIVAIYARYSSDMQNDRSIEDQVSECRKHLSEDDVLLDVFCDRAKSGSFMHTRPGLTALMKCVEGGQVDVILTESLDRLSRDIGDAAQIYRLATFHNVVIQSIMDGPIDELKVGFKGTMNGLFLKDLKARTRRGQAGKIRLGRAAGGLPYGYRVCHLNDDGVPERGLREIDEDQAEIVRSIYRDYASGMPVAHIVRRLNTAGIASPRGRKWSGVTLTGHYDRGDGILQNALYRGVLVWGRCPEVIHPVTSQRKIRVAEQADWEIQDVPHLRIVSDELWFAAHERRKATYRKIHRWRKFDQLSLCCACARCEGQLTRIEDRYLICRNFKQYQTCAHDRRFQIENLVDTVHRFILENGTSVWKQWLHQLEFEHCLARDRLAGIMARQSALKLENGNLVRALADGLERSKTVAGRILDNEAELDRLAVDRRQIETLPSPESLNFEAFRKCAAAASNPAKKMTFLGTYLTQIACDHSPEGGFQLVRLVPNFEALSELSPQQA